MSYHVRIICLCVAVAVFSGCASEVTLAVPDMMCEESCAVKVHDVLAKQDGVRSVQVDFPHRTATLSVSNSRFNIENAIAALVDHGFEEARAAKPGEILATQPVDSPTAPTVGPTANESDSPPEREAP
jgi:mercuric ion binding protein